MGRKVILRPIFFFAITFLIISVLPLSALADIHDDLNHKGIAQMRNRNYREAIVYFESAIKYDPDDASIKKNLCLAYHNRAAEYFNNNELANAINSEKQALKYAPEDNIIREQLAVYLNNYALKYADSNKYRLAQDKLRQAIGYSPDSDFLTKNLYNVTLQYADYSLQRKNAPKALRLADKAIELMPDMPSAYVFAGNVYYNLDDFNKACAYWEKALKQDPGNEIIRERIEKLQKEQAVEESFGTKKRSHFRLRFDKDLDPDYVSLISVILEDARKNIRSDFYLSADEAVPVIVYADEQFQAATSQPYLTQGLYDGKIRLKSQDISRGDEILRRVLFHEYAHAVLYLNFGANIPAWLHEGFAQFNEPDRSVSRNDIKFIYNYIDTHEDFSLEGLEDIFQKKASHDTIRAAYIQAKLFFAYLLEKYGKYKLKRLFKSLEEGNQWQEAVKVVYRRNIPKINNDFNDYLRGRYLRGRS